MHEFTITDMSCGHCVGVITKTVQQRGEQPVALLGIGCAGQRVLDDAHRDGLFRGLGRRRQAP